MRAERRKVVAVVGASSADARLCHMAEEVGRAVAAAGWHLLTGGGGGVMEAACRGFAEGRGEGSGTSIGVLPAEDEGFANAFLDIALPTGMGFARNALIARAACGVIAVGGCSGTLSEIALAWQMGKPIVALEGSGGWAARLAGERLDERRRDRVLAASSADEAVRLLRDRLANP